MPTFTDRVHGCLLGFAAGDALGARCRGMTAADIFRQFGLLPQMLADLPAGPLRATNAPPQALAVADHLAACGEIVGRELTAELATRHDPERPHGRAAAQVSDAAVRAAAIGLAFAADLDRVWAEAKASARPTHPDPGAVEAAQLFAGAVALAARGESADRRDFLAQLLGRTRSDEFRWALQTARKLKRSDSVAVLGSDPAVARSVVTAVACFAATPDDFELAVGRALGLGGATDALAAMSAALCGAAGGPGVIPQSLVGRLEPLPIADTAHRLVARFASIAGSSEAKA